MKPFLLVLSCFFAVAAEAAKPNVLLILADDLGYHDLGFQGSGHIKTPHLDWLTENGIRFPDGHAAASVCSPSRAGLMTGRYQQRFGHEANGASQTQGMDVGERTMAQALKAYGYRTALFGKWHLGSAKQFYPTARGFDEFCGLRSGSRSYWYDKKKSDRSGRSSGIERNGEQISFEGHLTDRLADWTIDYINEKSKKPFFVFLSFTAPHTPLQSRPEDLEALTTKDPYAGLVYGMDRNIGRVLDALRQNGKLENTLIWFLSDNGGTAKQASNYPLAGMKGTELEGGQRVPFLVYWPGHLEGGKVYSPMVSALDIFPTSVAAAGGSLEQERPLDGVNLLPYLDGTADGIPHEQLYWRKMECAAMRDGDWKLIQVDKMEDRLFNLKNDLSEHKNLADTYPERLARMQKMLRHWESDKVKPLWGYGEGLVKKRYEKYRSWYEDGVRSDLNK